ncbi:MAG: hypothetical protein ACOC3X_03475 [Nanoarchaeota archaeon]
MPERRTIATLKIKYEGLFRLNDLYDVIEHWTKERGYDKQEKINHEQILKTGREIFVETQPTKAFTDYDRVNIKINIIVKNMKDVMIKQDNLDVLMNQGKVVVSLTGYYITDYAGRWEGKPWFFFLRAVFDKWIYPVNTSKHESAANEEVNHLYQLIKGYLNMNKYN